MPRPGRDIDVATDMVESGAAVKQEAAAKKEQQKGAPSSAFDPFVDDDLPAAGAAVVAKKTCQNVPDEAKVWFLHFHAYQKNPCSPRQKVRHEAPAVRASAHHGWLRRWRSRSLALLFCINAFES